MYTFAAYPVIEKYMIAPPPAKAAAVSETAEIAETADAEE
jgi:hypothetical protein